MEIGKLYQLCGCHISLDILIVTRGIVISMYDPEQIGMMFLYLIQMHC
jgi:hypothetical protein